MPDPGPDTPPEDQPAPDSNPIEPDAGALDPEVLDPESVIESPPPTEDPVSVPDEPAPPAPSVLYAEIPDPFAEGSLVAHDRQALVAAIAARDRRRGIQSAEDLIWSPESRVRDIEEAALARIRGSRSRLRYRRIFWRILALALPFLVASLLGAAGLLIRRIPILGDPVGEFVGSAGASLGGLPLAFSSLSCLPSGSGAANPPFMTATGPDCLVAFPTNSISRLPGAISPGSSPISKPPSSSPASSPAAAAPSPAPMPAASKKSSTAPTASPAAPASTSRRPFTSTSAAGSIARDSTPPAVSASLPAGALPLYSPRSYLLINLPTPANPPACYPAFCG